MTQKEEATNGRDPERSPKPAEGQRKKPAGKNGSSGKNAKKRTKARSGNEKLTPAAMYRKMITFGKIYQIRDQIAEEGLTVTKTYKTGEAPMAHPLLSELPRHVESANKCLATIGNMITERGARVERAARDLDAFRLHA